MIFDLDIDALTLGGRGLGRRDGKAVFVPYAAPGDRLRCQVTRSRSRFDEAEIVELIIPSPLRRAPRCPVFGQCGGCQWQHLAYDVQTKWKEQLFQEQLLRSGVAAPDVFMPIVPAPSEWGYRNRAQFKCRQSNRGFVAGFYRQASHYVIDAQRCDLLMPPIQEAYAFLRKVLPTAHRTDAIPQVDVACSDDAHVSILLHALPDAGADLRKWLLTTAKEGGFSAALQCGDKETIEAVAGDAGLVTVVDDPPLSLKISAGGFSQVNPAQNRQLVDAVVAAAALTGRERLLDLYCGVGNFTLPLARRAGAVVGVESYPPAIADAIGNAAAHGLDNAHFFAEPAEGAGLRHGAFDLVLLDPPRTGAYLVMSDLLALQPRRILYVSCEPSTLVRDLALLVNNGYSVISSQPFDFFPQTWHIESLTVLELQSG